MSVLQHVHYRPGIVRLAYICCIFAIVRLFGYIAIQA
jgi:hypothetical protein